VERQNRDPTPPKHAVVEVAIYRSAYDAPSQWPNGLAPARPWHPIPNLPKAPLVQRPQMASGQKASKPFRVAAFDLWLPNTLPNTNAPPVARLQVAGGQKAFRPFRDAAFELWHPNTLPYTQGTSCGEAPSGQCFEPCNDWRVGQLASAQGPSQGCAASGRPWRKSRWPMDRSAAGGLLRSAQHQELPLRIQSAPGVVHRPAHGYTEVHFIRARRSRWGSCLRLPY
jgi:hypothetical protein